jgi:hypothetical protein
METAVAFEMTKPVADYTPDELTALYTEAETEFNEVTARDHPTKADVARATELAEAMDQIKAEQDDRATAVTDMAKIREDRAAKTTDKPVDKPEGKPDGKDGKPEVVEGEVVKTVDAPEGKDGKDGKDGGGSGGSADADGKEVEKVAAKGRVAAYASKLSRPDRPVHYDPIVITAAADVQGYSTGGPMAGVRDISLGAIARTRAFPEPTGDGQLQKYGVALLRKQFPDDLVIDRPDDGFSVIEKAGDESRLPGGSLVAAGGWCAPSETLYDFCEGESLDGMLDLPEVQVRRGGIRYTTGPVWSDLYNKGFCQTEAQAIAGTAKTCYEVPCPTFTEARLDACGLCIKVPILTNAAYPELVDRVIRGTIVGHQHVINARVISAISTAIGAATVGPDMKGTAGSSLAAIELATAGLRDANRLALNASMEVVLPHWVKGAVKLDLSMRNGRDEPATDADVAAHFAAEGVRVNWVYDFIDLPNAPNPTAYPATTTMLVYPAGTFVKGTSDVINLSAVYDAASLATNIYTGLFMEEGILVVRRCFGGAKYTIPICNAGRTGINDVTCP